MKKAKGKKSSRDVFGSKAESQSMPVSSLNSQLMSDQSSSVPKLGAMKKGKLTLDALETAAKNTSTLREEYQTSSPSRASSLSSASASKILKRNELFDDFSESFFPLNKIQDVIAQLTQKNITLDFTSVEQLTDMVFYTLLTNKQPNKFAYVTGVNLTGCYNITDSGLKWISLCFPELETISLRGCNGVTETGVHLLLENCPKLKNLDLTGTNVMILSTKCAGKSVTLNACPLICPDKQSIDHAGNLESLLNANGYKKSADVDLIKVFVAKPVGKVISLVRFLAKEKDVMGDAVEVKLDYKLSDGITANLVECNEAAMDYFISKRMLCVLPYGADVGLTPENIASTLAKTVCHVLCKAPSVFVLVGLTSGSGTVSASPEAVKKALEKVLQETKNQISKTTDLVKTPMKLTGLEFKEQRMLAKGLNLADSLEFLKLLTVSVDLTKEAQSRTDLNKTLLQGRDMIAKIYPEFQEIASNVMSYILSDKAKAVLTGGIVSIEEAKIVNQKMMELFNIYGKAVVLEIHNSPRLVSSVEWMAGVLSFGLSKPSEGSNEFISSVQDGTPLWQKDVFEREITKKLKIDSEDRAKTAATLFHKLGFTIATGTLSTTFANLRDNPPPELAPAMKDSPDNMVWVVYRFEFPHSVFDYLTHRLTHLIMEFRKPMSVWKKGCFQQEGLLELILQLKTQENDTVLELRAQSPYAGKEDNIIANTVKRTWQMVEQYKMAVEYILYKLNLFYLVTSSSSHNKPENIKGVIGGHVLIEAPTKDNEPRKPMCSKCGTPAMQVTFQQELQRSTSTLMLKSFHIDAGDNMKVMGNMVTTPVGVSQEAKIKATLNPFEQGLIKFTLVEGKPEDYVFRVSSLGLPLSYIIDLKKKSVELKSESVEKTMTSLPEFEVGEVLMIQLLPDESFQGNAEFRLLLWKNTEKILEFKCPGTKYNVFVTMSPKSDNASMLVHGILPSISKITTILPKMRLEAKDRANPSLICVATVEEINENGHLLIHFDGWTKRYDYWTEPETEDIHPIGYMKVNFNTPGYTPELQAPKGYRKAFDWATYCEEVEALPVPFEFFNEKQISNTPTDEEDRVLSHLSGGQADSGSDKESKESIMSCTESKFTSRALEFEIMKRCTMTTEVINFFSANFKFFCLLPTGLDVNTLRYPLLQRITDNNQQMIHILCPGNKIELLHFVDHPGIALNKFKTTVKQIASYVSVCFIGILLQEGFLPACPKSLVKGADSVSASQQDCLEMQIKRMLYLYILWLDQVEAVNKINQTTGDSHMAVLTEIQNDKSVCQELGKVFNLSHGFKTTGINSCMAHSMALSAGQNMNMLDMSSFSDMYQFMQKIDFRKNSLEDLPKDFLTNFIRIEELNLSENMLTAVPEGFSNTKWLTHLDVSKNRITSLPNDLGNLAKILQHLDISDNPFQKLPEVVWSLISLTSLHANNIGKIDHLEKIVSLVELEELCLASNIIDTIPKELSKLPLTYLNLSGVPWFPDLSTGKSLPTFKTFQSILDHYTVFGTMLSEKEKQDLFKKIDKDSSGALDKDEIAQMNVLLFEMFPRFGVNKNQYQETGGMPDVIFKLKKLERLEVAFHGIKFVPDDIKELKNFHSLDISHNPQLESISGELGSMKMKEINLNDCPSLKTPPKEVVARGFQAVFGYLQRLLLGSVSCKRTKLMMVGLGGAGKTSLVRALTSRHFQAYFDYGEQITDGIDINDWKLTIPGEKDPLIYSVWDFAGQTVYYNTHQFFLSNRAVYLLLWNIRLGYEHAGLDFWLSSIACHAPKAPIIVVGTHCDKVERSKIPKDELKRKYPQIAEFFFVSAYTGERIPELKEFLVQLTLKQKYMGERVPEAWLTLEKKVVAFRQEDKRDLVKWEEVEEVGYTCGIMDNNELVQAVQFLHDLGSLQFFNTEFLRSYVVIYPQWIVDVMACIVTVHVGPIQEGRLEHTAMKEVWQNYDVSLHPWLLRLTEEFDLTFPLEHEPVNLVPCLLPDEEKEYKWPSVDSSTGFYETKMIYNFDYLPAGLFNRAQVRLHKYTDGGKLWQKGMFLKKNDHIALVLQKENKVFVKGQGVKPENMLFLVHEVFETLIRQWYSGVQYDFLIPCMECVSMNLTDPSMFSAAKIQRAGELNAMFLQCENLFHVLSIAELQAAMPPDHSADYDSYLRQNVQELQNLGEDATVSTVFCYTKKNVPGLDQENTHVHPGQIMEDLRALQFNVAFCDNPETADMSSLTLTFKSAKVILIGISDEFCAEESCRNIITFVKETLRIPILLVVIGKTMKWEKSNLALSISDEVYVKMNDPSRYSTKIKELADAIRKKTSKKLVTESIPEVFLSYCWSNSQDAISKGSRKKEGALGWGDPRELKSFLEKNGCPCWIDVERVGGGGLFEDIAEGLRKAKVVVACVSDEYVKSNNCVMEFRFALSKLRIPVILAVVGTGYQWERSEIGMLAVGQKCPKINFQYENLSAHMELLENIQGLLKNQVTTETKVSLEEQHKVAFKEVLELSQRQFLRHIVGYADAMYTGEYPRLIVIDLVEDKTEEDEKVNDEMKKKIEIYKKTKHKDCECKDEGGHRVLCKHCCELGEDLDDEEEEDKRKAKYCYRFLCEYEEGWHPTAQTIPFPEYENNEEEEEWLSTMAPYAARIFAILKYTNLNMSCLNTPEGQTLQEKLQTIVSSSNQKDFQEEYTQIRQNVMEMDVDKIQGGLKKCQMMNGKTLWLCEEHRKQSGSRTEKMFQEQLASKKKETLDIQKTDMRPKTPKQKEPPRPLKSTQQPSESEKDAKKQTSVFKMRETAMSPGGSKKLKRQTSQACSVM